MEFLQKCLRSGGSVVIGGHSCVTGDTCDAGFEVDTLAGESLSL